MKHALILALGVLSACSPKTVTQDRPVRVAVPVPAPCVSERPARVMAIADTYPEWDSMDVRQKAAAVSESAVKLRTYSEQLNAATMACKERQP